MAITKNHVKSAARVGGGVSTAVVIAAVCFWGNSLLGWGTGMDDRLGVVKEEVIEVKKDVEYHQQFIVEQKVMNKEMMEGQHEMALDVKEQGNDIKHIIHMLEGE